MRPTDERNHHQKLVSEIQAMIDDPSTSNTLKAYLTSSLARDRADIINELEAAIAAYHFDDIRTGNSVNL